ncbi:uncharacterized protein BDZ83DRAFT_598085 [Colletotrichum acutatum]|uniref:Uncharacterized protein n=1 Tax=Glomerella acutata TaxID=27357 RepID=A0AAD8XQ34_GLOAC|nr:uncharacterized protein BDZ83DRAFT_598085 [Colletotrichum acutatum]KAK1731615.1 hypothetical protein BDZ83DRAFT_598085 [Colletotrichum acutatum]
MKGCKTFSLVPWVNVGTEAMDEHVLSSGNEKKKRRSGKQREGKETGENVGESGSGVNSHPSPPMFGYAPQTGVILLMHGEEVR